MAHFLPPELVRQVHKWSGLRDVNAFLHFLLIIFDSLKTSKLGICSVKKHPGPRFP